VKELTLQIHGKDKYRRTLADVLLPDGNNVNYTLVREGWCWWYRRYAPGNTVLEGLEKEAREAKKGLWADPRRSRRGSGGRGQNGPTNENCKSNQRFQGKYDCRRCWLRDCGSDRCGTFVTRAFHYRFASDCRSPYNS
jgi:hypothetical protein